MIAQNKPAANTRVTLHTVSDTPLYVASLYCCNTGDAADKISVAIVPEGATDVDACWITRNLSLFGNETYNFGGMELPQGTKIDVLSVTGNVVFTLTGQGV